MAGVVRTCGDCQKCCSLMPVPPIDKPGWQRCAHQRHHKGCAIYDRRPIACQVFACKWLTGQGTAGMRRPDRAYYVIDAMPDFIVMTYTDPDRKVRLPVDQIWMDPRHPGAAKDPELRAYIEARATEGVDALLRWGRTTATALFAPSLSDDGQWHEVTSSMCEVEHTPEEIADAVGGIVVRVEA